MTFRRRLLVACAAAVAGAIALASLLAYEVVRSTLRGKVDDSLRVAGATLPPEAGTGQVTVSGRFSRRTEPPAGADVVMLQALRAPVLFTQVFSAAGAQEGKPLPHAPGPLVSEADLRALAKGRRKPFFTERDYRGTRLRVYATRLADGRAVVVARPLTEVDSVLGTMRIGLGVLIVAGVGLALLLARLATQAAVKPVAELTETAEHVARTRDLTRRIAADGSDELSRLAASFNTMFEALEDSRRAQRRLVADASHELRTPLTALRTNLEVLGAGGSLDERDREKLRADVVGQLEELIALVSDLVDLAREEEPCAEREEVRFDELVAAAVERVSRHAPDVRFDCELEPALIDGVPARLDRAVANLLDNAAKWSPPGATVDVRLRDGELSVRDRGPGIAADDQPFVFDRFYRAPGARGLPGSGLGLAIVRQVAEAHGGGVAAAPAPDGGALLVLRLPMVAVPLASASS